MTSKIIEIRDSGTFTANLDILRSTAVLAVLFAHLMPFAAFVSVGLRGTLESRIGRFGVLLFFVHTALVLMLSIARMSGQRGWVKRFYIRRAFRIYPLSLLCVAVVLAGHVPPVFGSTFIRPTHWALLANLTMMQNLTPFASVSGPLWSLPFEIQMYLILPGIFFLICRDRNNVYALLPVSLFIAVAEKALFASSIAGFFPCFMGGVLAFALKPREKRLPAFCWIPAIGLLGIAGCLSGLAPIYQWTVSLALGAMLPWFRDCTAGLLSRAAALIARYSYGIYLSHVPLRWLFLEQLGGQTGWLLFLISVPLVSVALYHAVEEPMIRHGRLACNR